MLDPQVAAAVMAAFSVMADITEALQGCLTWKDQIWGSGDVCRPYASVRRQIPHRGWRTPG